MRNQQFTDRQSEHVRQYEYDNSYVIAADLGVPDDDIDVDILGETAIVVIETDGEVNEAEFELPGTGGDAVVNNGILTITVEK